MTFDVGDRLRSAVVFRDATAVADPTTITVTVTEPDGTATDYVYGTDEEVTKQSTGNYRIDMTIDAVGDWKTKWTGEGAVIASTSEHLTHVEN